MAWATKYNPVVIHHVRRMASLGGWTTDAIARVYGLRHADVLAILALPGPRPRHQGEARCIKGLLASRVRNRHAAGWTAEVIAEGLGLDPSSVRAFLFPPPPPPPPPRQPRPIEPERLVRRQGDGPLKRPRFPAEQAALSEWSRFLRDDPDPPAAAPELLDVEARDLVEVEPQICPTMLNEEWGSWHASTMPGGRSGNAALTDADAVSIRQRRAEGASRKDLAAEFGVSVATITRITRGDTYRDAEAVEPHDLVTELPATSPVEGPEPERWEPEPGDRRRRGND